MIINPMKSTFSPPRLCCWIHLFPLPSHHRRQRLVPWQAVALGEVLYRKRRTWCGVRYIYCIYHKYSKVGLGMSGIEAAYTYGWVHYKATY